MRVFLISLSLVIAQFAGACTVDTYAQFHQQVISIKNINMIHIESSRVMPSARVEATFSNVSTIAGNKLSRSVLSFPIGACGGRNIVTGMYYVLLTDGTEDLTIQRGDNRILGIELRAYQNVDLAAHKLAAFVDTRLIKAIREARKKKTFDVNASWYRALQTEIGNTTFPVNY